MKLDKLFQVLVAGGAMISASGAYASDLDQAFCQPEDPEMCELDEEEGIWKAKEGLECCWGTTCEAEEEEE